LPDVNLLATFGAWLASHLCHCPSLGSWAPAVGQEFMVVYWLRSAAIIARKDPVAAGYLTKDERGRLLLPPLRCLASIPILQTLPDERRSLDARGLDRQRRAAAPPS
jgi:hypothetical protein